MPSDLDSTGRPVTMDASRTGGASTMATSTDQTARDLELQRERDKNFNAWALVVIGAIAVALTAIAVTVFLVTRDEEPAGLPPVDTAAEQADDEAAAIEAYREYEAAESAAYAANTIEGSGLEDYAQDSVLQQTQAFIDNLVRGGYTYTGTTEIVSVEPVNWEPEVVGGATVTLDTCVDVSAVRITDQAGNPVPIVNPDGTPNERTRLPAQFVMQEQGGWKVFGSTPDPDTSAIC